MLSASRNTLTNKLSLQSPGGENYLDYKVYDFKNDGLGLLRFSRRF